MVWHWIILILTVLTGVFVHFLPSVIAACREHRRMTAILLVNLLLGWTVIGWIAALVWAFSSNTRGREVLVDARH